MALPGEGAGEAGAVPGAEEPPAVAPPPAAEFPETGPQAVVSAAVHSTAAAPRTGRMAEVIGQLLTRREM
jgi:hypothetical protein